ncbi:hypothetical protein LSH36_534g00010 [Paralvinella palmiformis]|uniref:Hexosyltransferase n=1 Tax=Paralvinella palmiformis TaxID=53620 RepID=A0AAD9MXZ1_9ANNE|nr:hypothetical protein LSH36_534g00010 [Paralvinella palmiformis]
MKNVGVTRTEELIHKIELPVNAMKALTLCKLCWVSLMSGFIAFGCVTYYALLISLDNAQSEDAERDAHEISEMKPGKLERFAESTSDKLVTGSREIVTEILRHSETSTSRCIHQPNLDCTKRQTFVIYVYSGRNRTDRRQLIRNTWARPDQYGDLAINLQLFFVVGIAANSPSSSNLDVGLQKEIRRYHDILMCDFVDSYDNLTLKGLSALKWINSTCDLANLQFLFKTDDDVYVNLDKILHLANNATQTGSHFLGVCKTNRPVLRSGKWAIDEDDLPDDRYPEYCYGGGYGMTRKGFALLMDSVDRVPIFPMEDAFFTSLAIRWAHPGVNITYYYIKYRHARMEMSKSQIGELLHNKNRLLNFILGHPVTDDLWLNLHHSLHDLH